LSFLLTIEGMIATAFVIAGVMGILLPKRWKTIGWVLPMLAAAFAAVRLVSLADHRSREGLDIPFAALWAALGAYPGAALGSWLHRRFIRSA
jgi:hypothetical protein